MAAALAAALALAVTAPASRAQAATPAAPPAPAVAYATTTGVRVAAANGTVLHRYHPFETVSLDGKLLVGSRRGVAGSFEGLVAFDAATGTPRFTLPRAFAPVAVDGGRKVLFGPDRGAQRDPQVNSVWLREADGTVRRVVQFSNGGTLPGIRTGLPDAGLLGYAADATGRHVAVAEGNDVDAFRYDVWLVDTVARTTRRLTGLQHSRWPSVSPAGTRVALSREVADCGGHRFAANLYVVRVDGTAGRTLVPGTCQRFLSQPQWASEAGIVAYRFTRAAGGAYRVDLVAVNAASGTVTVLDGGGKVEVADTSPGRRLVAAVHAGAAGFTLRNLDTRVTRTFPAGAFPVPAGDHHF